MPDEESMIQDLRELEEELRQQEEYRKANIIDLFIRHSTHCKIDRSDIVKKIEELNEEEKELQNTISDEEREEYSDANIGYGLMVIENKIQVLQELLKEE